MVVGDRAPGREHRLRGRGLDLRPLLELGPPPRRREDRVVGRRAVRIHVGKAAGHGSLAADLFDRVTGPLEHGLVKPGEPVPRDRGLERLGEHADRDERVA